MRGPSTGQWHGPNDIFEIGSVTKVFTGYLLARALEQGAVSLDDTLDAHFPGGAPSFNGRSIALIDLATHTSGLPDYPGNMHSSDPANPGAGYTQQDLDAFMAAYPLTVEPGSTYRYSNLGAGTLGHVLVRTTMTADYEALVRQVIADPLQMNDTRTVLLPAQEPRRLQGYRNGQPSPRLDIGEPLAGGGLLRSTALDMLTFLDAALGVGPAQAVTTWGTTLLPRRQSPHGTNGETGLLINIEDHAGGRLYSKNGGTPGFSSQITLMTNPRIAVVLLANTNGTQGLMELGTALVDLLRSGGGGSSSSAGGATSLAGTACVPGRQVPCACMGGAQGVQVCRNDGSGFDACVCGTASSSASPGGGSGSSAAGATSSSASSGASGQSGIIDTVVSLDACKQLSHRCQAGDPASCGTCQYRVRYNAQACSASQPCDNLLLYWSFMVCDGASVQGMLDGVLAAHPNYITACVQPLYPGEMMPVSLGAPGREAQVVGALFSALKDAPNAVWTGKNLLHAGCSYAASRYPVVAARYPDDAQWLGSMKSAACFSDGVVSVTYQDSYVGQGIAAGGAQCQERHDRIAEAYTVLAPTTGHACSASPQAQCACDPNHAVRSYPNDCGGGDCALFDSIVRPAGTGFSLAPGVTAGSFAVPNWRIISEGDSFRTTSDRCARDVVPEAPFKTLCDSLEADAARTCSFVARPTAAHCTDFLQNIGALCVDWFDAL
ncbi:MAG: beta-lactamase family protein [Deltaproteobacteria bacterium]|nr:beta-lactamase family protein [Deltaproteobacteria bacterium]